MLNRRDFLYGAAGVSALLTAPALAQPGPKKRVIVDAQIHMWKANTPDRPWVPGTRPQIPEPNTIERVVPMIDEAGVDRVVIVPPTLEGLRVDYGQEAARRYPGRFATMGSIKLEDPNEAQRVAVWRDQPNVLGIRLNVVGEQAKWLSDGTADWLWAAAEKYNVPIMFLTRGQLALFGPIAERYPGLPLIIDHMGVSTDALKEGLMPAMIATGALLAKYPNISVKLSATPLFSTQDYPWRDITPHIKRLFDAFGPRRCHWGTDVTNSWAKANYKQRVAHFLEELPFLTEDDKDWVMGKAILEKLRWA